MDIATTLEGAAALLTVLVILGGGVYALGKFRGVVDANTAATEKLTIAFEKHSDRTDNRIDDHEIRITLLEGKKR